MIQILPESKGNTLVVQATGTLTTKDYDAVFIPALKQRIQEYGKIRGLIYFDEGFEGWELEAMWDDARFGITHRNDFEKMAVVGGPQWVDWAMKVSSIFMAGQLKTFSRSELQLALQWIGE